MERTWVAAEAPRTSGPLLTDAGARSRASSPDERRGGVDMGFETNGNRGKVQVG